MHLENLRLQNFKNYEFLQLNFTAGINCLVGKNGSGKTNLLDAIYYLSLTKSAFNSADTQSIRHGESYFSLMGDVFKGERKLNLHCVLQNGQKKVFKLNKSPYEKIRDHIGLIPLVMIAPGDTDLIQQGSETRRRFFDSLICQIDNSYLEALVLYYHYLKQRNALLKSLAPLQKPDPTLLSRYDSIIVSQGINIYRIRNDFCNLFGPKVKEHYQQISEGRESVGLNYQSDFAVPEYESLYFQALRKDLQFQRTTFGIHTDDYHFNLDGYPAKRFGSQGQQKSLLIALKLAQFEIMQQKTGHKPLLLLDDIFDKLDDQRIGSLLNLISAGFFGQVFITDARPERTEAFLGSISADRKVYQIEDGKLIA